MPQTSLVKISQGAAQPVFQVQFRPVGRHQSQTINQAAHTPTVPGEKVNWILVQALTQNVRYTIDPGQPPTATTGFQLVASAQEVLIPINPQTLIRFFGEAAGAVVQYQFGE